MNIVTLNSGQQVANVHSREVCKGEFCTIHNPSDHHMKTWKQIFREEGFMERICEHGICHPDPDDIAFFKRAHGQDISIHGCDGCCAKSK